MNVKRYSFDLMDTHTGSGDMRERKDGEWVCYDDYAALEKTLDEAVNRLNQHTAARLGYASEFPRAADGEPDVGSIHANIRAMKQRNAELEAVARKLLAIGGCFKAWEHELRHVAGNTNVNIALMRLQDLEAALGKATP